MESFTIPILVFASQFNILMNARKRYKHAESMLEYSNICYLIGLIGYTSGLFSIIFGNSSLLNLKILASMHTLVKEVNFHLGEVFENLFGCNTYLTISVIVCIMMISARNGPDVIKMYISLIFFYYFSDLTKGFETEIVVEEIVVQQE